MINMTETKQLKLILVGDVNVGKTSILHRLIFSKFTDEYKSTIGADFLSKTFYQNDIITHIQLWDTAGQEKYWCLTSAFWRTSDAVILVFDIGNESSFRNLNFWYKQFKSKSINPDGTEKQLPILLLANKSDSLTRAVDQSEINQWCTDHKVNLYYEVSAKSSKNIKESILKLVEVIIEQDKDSDNEQFNDSPEEEISSITLLGSSSKKSDNTSNKPSTSSPFSCFNCK
ncbi:hypothetical protein RB653_000944 [Dictyostelium firmibasis]|uniref:Uncharacterized protein n=1 Tax=Dictyostelium firmibasis TaxID=79012 RepID=A0AAN7TW41_9MYCE